MKTIATGKHEIVGSAIELMEHKLESEKISSREALAETCRILHAFGFGHDSGLAGQVTARGEKSGTYWTQRLGLGLDEITAENLLLVDEDLNVIQGGGMANPANRFHSWLYRARPDVGSIVHSHPPYLSALSMLEVPLNISHMDACILYGQVGFLKKWPGIPVGNEEGELITKSIGQKKAILLAHHGMLVAGESVQEACVMSVMFERAARLQLLAMAAGDIQPIESELGEEAQRWISTPRRTDATFSYYARWAGRRQAE